MGPPQQHDSDLEALARLARMEARYKKRRSELTVQEISNFIAEELDQALSRNVTCVQSEVVEKSFWHRMLRLDWRKDHAERTRRKAKELSQSAQ